MIGRVRSDRALFNLAMYVNFLTISRRLLNSIGKCIKYTFKTIRVVNSPHKASYER